MAIRALLGKADFARKVGVTKQAIGVACRAGGPLASAVVDGKIDAKHRDAVAYAKRAKARAAGDEKNDPPALVEGFADDGTPGAMVDVANLTLREIEERFDGRERFDAWLRSLKTTEEVREKRLKNEETDGSLISREFVKTHVFGLLEEMTQRLLGELPQTMAKTVRSHEAAGVELEISEREIRATVGKALDAAKTKIARKLRKA